MEETRESRMNSVVEMAISSTLESCSNENFLACFAEFQSEEDKKALLNLRELFLQLLASSIKHDVSLISEELKIPQKLAELDRSTRSSVVVGLPAEDPKLVMANLRCALKRQARDKLLEMKAANDARLAASRGRYNMAKQKVGLPALY
uniref:Uncharacterized protein n=1 Tax=Rhodosorus marinus TaxID=101924 RepID=A0A7S3E5E4_9RHOD|mmetsp:Transcript_10126/g.42521  ORF Transcript_10126/g.42521 Transcript_10126/m.42521 type:complete len:148 (+) Transcript_10126:179-622(+)